MPCSSCAGGAAMLVHGKHSDVWASRCVCPSSGMHAGAADVRLQALDMVSKTHVRCEARLLLCAGHSR